MRYVILFSLLFTMLTLVGGVWDLYAGRVNCLVCEESFDAGEIIKPYVCQTHGFCKICFGIWGRKCPCCRAERMEEHDAIIGAEIILDDAVFEKDSDQYLDIVQWFVRVIKQKVDIRIERRKKKDAISRRHSDTDIGDELLQREVEKKWGAWRQRGWDRKHATGVDWE